MRPANKPPAARAEEKESTALPNPPFCSWNVIARFQICQLRIAAHIPGTHSARATVNCVIRAAGVKAGRDEAGAAVRRDTAFSFAGHVGAAFRAVVLVEALRDGGRQRGRGKDGLALENDLASGLVEECQGDGLVERGARQSVAEKPAGVLRVKRAVEIDARRDDVIRLGEVGNIEDQVPTADSAGQLNRPGLVESRHGRRRNQRSEGW